MANNTRKALRMIKNNSRQEKRTAIGTELYLPNHSGIADHPEFKSHTFWSDDGTTLTTKEDRPIEVRGSSSGQSTISSGLVVNDGSGGNAADNFRVETAANSNAFLIDASLNEIQINSKFLLEGGTTPTSATDTGTEGEIRWDSDYIYICTATDTWKRGAIATW